jgi:hypothetical protein
MSDDADLAVALDDTATVVTSPTTAPTSQPSQADPAVATKAPTTGPSEPTVTELPLGEANK